MPVPLTGFLQLKVSHKTEKLKEFFKFLKKRLFINVDKENFILN